MTGYDKVAHLQMIQGVISRLAANSFQFKAWCIAIVSALVATAWAIENSNLCLLASAPVLSFLWLDARYLRDERRFRKLYSLVAEEKVEMDYDMNPSLVDSTKSTIDSAVFSPVVLGFYGPVLMMLGCLFLLAPY
ncbi:hypothetical protein R0137_11060 [Congregibacter brevis]|uniref:Uncharacterized protein n=1 Tax=Congregibacter brevis TaxID=3081201 RepID=A0ABZ0I9N0_9GAMM|nr:hypothetical protein R0137_11060 [Congregibacter sp. IMCC45268]